MIIYAGAIRFNQMKRSNRAQHYNTVQLHGVVSTLMSLNNSFVKTKICRANKSLAKQYNLKETVTNYDLKLTWKVRYFFF